MQHTHQENKADVSAASVNTKHNSGKAYFVGSGIASLAGAAFLIRDGLIPGEAIHIIEELKITGGSLDGAGSAEKGYVVLNALITMHR